MSTRSIIGVALDNGFEGRYCHWDGYPSTRGEQLLQTYRDLGSWEAVRDYALRRETPGYWSSYQPPSELTDGYRTDNGDSWGTNAEDWGAEWAYLLSERGITVLENRDEWRRVALVAWDATPDWEAIENGAVTA